MEHQETYRTVESSSSIFSELIPKNFTGTLYTVLGIGFLLFIYLLLYKPESAKRVTFAIFDILVAIIIGMSKLLFAIFKGLGTILERIFGRFFR